MSENIHHLSGNLLVGSSHFFVDTTNNRVGITTADPDAGLHVNSNAYVHTDFRVGSGIVMNVTGGRITAGSFEGDGSLLENVPGDSGSWVNGSSSNIHLAVSTDNVGIGTDSPAHKLDVDGDINISSGSTLKVGGTPAVFSNWSVDGSNIYRSTGNVGIGTTSPGHTLDVTGDINFSGNIRKNGAIQTFALSSAIPDVSSFITNSTSSLDNYDTSSQVDTKITNRTSYEYTSGGTTTKFRTGSQGSLKQNNGRNIGESASQIFSIWESDAGGEGSWIAIGGDYITMCSPTDSNYSIVYFDEDNGVGGSKKWHINATGTLVSTSDSRLKHDIKPLIWENVLEKIGNLEPSTFKFKCPESCDRDKKKWDIEHIGFIAQNVQANFPELICEDDESSENYLMVNITMMILPIIQGTQQLTTDLQTTKEELQTTATNLQTTATNLQTTQTELSDLKERLNTHTHPLEEHTHPLEEHTHPLEEHTHPEIAIEKAKTHELQQRLTLIEHSHAALVARLEALENI